MASLFEPPALLTLVVLLAGGTAAIYHALRPALRGPLPVVTSERDEVWGVEDPPPPAKRPYVYAAEHPVTTLGAEREPEPLALMPGGPTVAPHVATIHRTPAIRAVGEEDEFEEDEEELSLTDLFRPKRRSHAAPNDAPTQD